MWDERVRGFCTALRAELAVIAFLAAVCAGPEGIGSLGSAFAAEVARIAFRAAARAGPGGSVGMGRSQQEDTEQNQKYG